MALRNRNGTWHYRFQVAGRRYQETTGLAATKRNVTAAQQIENDHRTALMEGRSPSRRVQVRQFNDAATDFLEWAKAEYREHPSSAKRLATSFASLTEFFSTKPVSLISPGNIEDFKAWRIGTHEVRDVTLRHDLHALSKFYGYAIKQRWTLENPVASVKIPSDAAATRIYVLTVEEERVYFTRAASNRDLHDAAKLILLQGMRPEEVVSLRKDDVELERGQLKVTAGKTNAARRTLDLTNESRTILAGRMEGISPWVFPSKRDGDHRRRLNNAHDTLLENATEEGVKLSFVLYDLRHTFATRMAQAGVDLATLAAILGHSSIRIVSKYVHPTADHKKQAMLIYEKASELEQKKAAAARPN